MIIPSAAEKTDMGHGTKFQGVNKEVLLFDPCMARLWSGL
jgi:hypothetical protein